MNINKIFIFLILNNIFHINSLKIEEIIKNLEKEDKKIKDISYSYLQDIKNDNEHLIDISDEYDLINPKNPDYFYIPILGSSDIHGHFYPEELEIGNISYSKGGLDYLAKYINILREEFQNNFLYLDAGDLFQGGTESTLTHGEIIMDYLNLINVDAVAFGNHEYDEDRETLEQKVDGSKFPFLTANIFDIKKNTKKAFGKNHFSSKIFTFEVHDTYTQKAQVKIGIIGLTLKRLKNQMSGKGYEHIIFSDYKDELISEANKLKKENNVNAVILLAHILLECEDENNNLVLKKFKPTDKQSPCDNTNDLYKLIDSLDEGVIDAVVAGHSHKQVHHWIKNIPIISPINNGLYTNVLYLAFDRKNNYKIVQREAFAFS
jgi:5'-nucleotidase